MGFQFSRADAFITEGRHADGGTERERPKCELDRFCDAMSPPLNRATNVTRLRLLTHLMRVAEVCLGRMIGSMSMVNRNKVTSNTATSTSFTPRLRCRRPCWCNLVSYCPLDYGPAVLPPPSFPGNAMSVIAPGLKIVMGSPLPRGSR